MVGFRQAWRVSGLTKEYAVQQGPVFHSLGSVLRDTGVNAVLSGDSSLDAATQAKMVPLARKLLDLRKCHDAFVRGVEHQHDSAVEFLTLFAALATGLDGTAFEWPAIRQLSQGVYTCMVDTPSVHKAENVPNFDAVCDVCRQLLAARPKGAGLTRPSGQAVTEDRRDQVEGAKGMFGYQPTNPIPADGNWYCRRLRCPAGHPYWFHRLGNIGRGPDGHIVDRIEAQCFGGEDLIHLFFDMYHTVPSSHIPEGLSMGTDAGRGSTRGRVSPFPDALFEHK